MILHGLLVVLGLVLLIAGGEAMVRGASGLARRMGVSPLLIGLTIVSFGTSAPELTVNLTAAVADRGELSFGNIIGSNIANIGLILAVIAIIRPLVLQKSVVLREIPMGLLAGAAVLVMSLGLWLDDLPPLIRRADGIVLLLLFCVFLYYTFAEAVRSRAGNGSPGPDAPAPPALPAKRHATAVGIAFLLTGFIGLALGGRVTVVNAAALAETMGVPEVIIGLTVIAIGTSMPELAASMVALARGETDLAVGNVVGSNIFNLLFIMGISATVRPVPVPAGGLIDLALMLGISAALLPMAVTHRRRLMRWEGSALLGIYIAYLIARSALLGGGG